MKEMVLANLDNLERTVLNFLNLKLKVTLTGNETIIDLSNKNVGNTEFNLISEIRFKNAKQIILKKNEISDISNLEKLKTPNLQVLDLSYNKINNINPFKKFSQTKQKIKKIYLNNNNIEDADIFKEKIFDDLVEINLDENHISQKDIEYIKDIIEGKVIHHQPSIKKDKKNKIKNKGNLKNDKVSFLVEEDLVLPKINIIYLPFEKNKKKDNDRDNDKDNKKMILIFVQISLGKPFLN